MKNPLLIDPTRTVMLRRRFSAEVSRRFAKFRRELSALIATEDAFGIVYRQAILNNEPMLTFTGNSRWAFLSTPEQLQQFQYWLEAQIALDFMQQVGGAHQSDNWLSIYIREAYLKGQARGFDEVTKPALWTGTNLAQQSYIPQSSATSVLQGAKLQFMGGPVSRERLALLTARAQAELSGITAAMSQQISRELLDSMVRDLTPKEIALNVLDRVDKVGKTRALALVQSEVVRAHSEGILDAMESLGVAEVGVMVEWTTASNPCSVCQALRGVVMPIAKARGLFPRHPRCRCSPIPANKTREGNREQIRDKRKIQAAIHRSIRAEYPKRSLAKAKDKSRWAKAVSAQPNT